jgi:hypothetical protein
MMEDLFSDVLEAPAAAAVPAPEPTPVKVKKTAPAPAQACPALPSMERIAELAQECGALAPDASEEARTQAIAQTLAKLLQEVQAAPAGLPPASRVLCWVMDSELAKFAPLRVIRALQPYAVANGEPMYPLYVPDVEPRK